jgi:hypothetical protein
MFDNLERKIYVGIVESVKDPNHKGRIKVRIQGLYDNMAVEDIPYASPYNDINGTSFKLPAVHQIVNVMFLSNNLYDPTYLYSENSNINLQDKLKSLSDSEYETFVALLFDHKTQIYRDDTELTLDYLYNKITISNDDINLELKDNNRKVNIGTKNANQPALMTIHFFDWMDSFVRALLIPTSLTGNMGAPVIKPQIDTLLNKYLSIKKTFLSNHVYIVDNNKIEKIE